MAKERKEQQCSYCLGRQRAESKQERWKGIQWDPFDINLIFFLFLFGICTLAGKLTVVLSLKRSVTLHLYLHLTLGWNLISLLQTVPQILTISDSEVSVLDPKSLQLKYNVDLGDIQKISVTPLKDGVIVFHIRSVSVMLGESFSDVLISSFMHPISRDPLSFQIRYANGERNNTTQTILLTPITIEATNNRAPVKIKVWKKELQHHFWY